MHSTNLGTGRYIKDLLQERKRRRERGVGEERETERREEGREGGRKEAG